MTEINDQISVFNLSSGALDRVGRDGRPRSPYDFAARYGPRFGFAWEPFFLRRTVVRGGYGVFQSAVDRYNEPLTFPWGMASNVTISTVDNVTPPFTLSQGPPPSILKVAEGVTGPEFGASASNIQRKPAGDYVQNWQFSVQHELLPQKLLVDVAYAGSKGTHLLAYPALNQVALNQMGPGNAQARRPYPTYQAVDTAANLGSSIYHSLQAKAESRFWAGLNFLVSYTYAREIDDYSGPRSDVFNSGTAQFIQNVYNLRAERSVGGFNFPQRLVASYNYALPFGTGKRLLNGGGWSGRLLGGWQVSGIATMQKGGPVAISVTPNSCNCFNGGLRPNRIGDGRLQDQQRSLGRFFDTAAFAAPTTYTFGNSERNLMLAPGLVNFDFSLSKKTNFSGADTGRYAELRAEFFNACNTPQFASPNAVVGTPQFGMINGARAARVIQFALKVHF